MSQANDLVWCGFRHSDGALLLPRPQSLRPVFRPQPRIPVQSWKTRSIQRKLRRGCGLRPILQDRAWGVRDVSKRVDDRDFVRIRLFFPLPSRVPYMCCIFPTHARPHADVPRYRHHASDRSSSPRSVIRICEELGQLVSNPPTPHPHHRLFNYLPGLTGLAAARKTEKSCV